MKFIILRPTHSWLPRWLGMHHLVMIVLAIATCFCALLLAGCSSSRSDLPNIFLTELSYQQSAIGKGSTIPPSLNSTISSLVANASMTIRTGYFGICIKERDQDWICHKRAQSLETLVKITQDPLDLVSNSIAFRDSIVFPGLVYVYESENEVSPILIFFIGLYSLHLASFAFHSSLPSLVGENNSTT